MYNCYIAYYYRLSFNIRMFSFFCRSFMYPLCIPSLYSYTTYSLCIPLVLPLYSLRVNVFPTVNTQPRRHIFMLHIHILYCTSYIVCCTWNKCLLPTDYYHIFYYVPIMSLLLLLPIYYYHLCMLPVTRRRHSCMCMYLYVCTTSYCLCVPVGYVLLSVLASFQCSQLRFASRSHYFFLYYSLLTLRIPYAYQIGKVLLLSCRLNVP